MSKYHMKSFEVIGGKKLKGDLIPQGAKNEALQVICAVLLTPETVVISNIPDILDVRLLIGLLEELGVEVNRIDENTYSFKAENIHSASNGNMTRPWAISSFRPKR